MKIYLTIILLLLLFSLVYSNDNLNNKNINSKSIAKASDKLDELSFTEFITEDLSNNVTRAKFEKQLRLIFPNITHQDVEMIKQIRQMNFTKVIKALTKDDLNDIFIGIIAGVEKSINDSPGNCVESLRKQIDSTNQVIYDLFNIYGITIREFFNFLKVIPTVIKDDLEIYNTCGINKIVKKLSSCTNLIIHQGFNAFIENEKNVLLSNFISLLPITRGIASSLLIKNYQLFGVHLGEYLGILINAPPAETPAPTSPAITPTPTPTKTPTSTTTSSTSSFISNFFGNKN